jgi:LPS-assembly lipoprotein
VVLQALDDTRERSIVAQTSAAQVRELQLRLRFTSAPRRPAAGADSARPSCWWRAT